MDLKTLVDQPGKLPTVPKIVQKLIESFNADNIPSTEIAQQIASDPALSAKLLRLANSAYFHVSRTVGTVDDALRMLGFVMVRNLVLSSGMVAALPMVMPGPAIIASAPGATVCCAKAAPAERIERAAAIGISFMKTPMKTALRSAPGAHKRCSVGKSSTARERLIASTHLCAAGLKISCAGRFYARR